jgi:hypothetical protein
VLFLTEFLIVCQNKLGTNVSQLASALLILAFWFGPATAVKFGPLGQPWHGRPEFAQNVAQWMCRRIRHRVGTVLLETDSRLILAFWFGPATAVKFGPLGQHWLGFMDGATEA